MFAESRETIEKIPSIPIIGLSGVGVYQVKVIYNGASSPKLSYTLVSHYHCTDIEQTKYLEESRRMTRKCLTNAGNVYGRGSIM